LKVYHLPVTLTAVQFAIGTLLVAFMWGLNLYKRPKLTSSQVSTYFHPCSILLLLHLFCFCFIKLLLMVLLFSWRLQLLAIFPLALAHSLGNLFTNMSLGKVTVTFTHTVKSMEPFIYVLVSSMLLRKVTPNHYLFVVINSNLLCVLVFHY
jgi:solute carrier family 35 protein E1